MMKSKLIVLILSLLILSDAQAFLWIGGGLNQNEETAKAEWTKVAAQYQTQIDTAKQNLAEADFIDYQIQKNKDAQTEATAKIQNAQAALDAYQKSNTQNLNVTQFKVNLVAFTNYLAELKAEATKLTATQATLLQNDAAHPTLDTIRSQYAADANAFRDNLARLEKAGFSKKDGATLAKKTMKSDFDKMLKTADQWASTEVSTAHADDLDAYQKYRKTHRASAPDVSAKTPVAAAAPAAAAPGAPVVIPASVPSINPVVAVPAAKDALVKGESQAASQAAVAVATATKAAALKDANDKLCDQAYTEVAKMMMQNPDKNGKILSEMIRSAAIKMAKLAGDASTTKSLEAYANSKDIDYSDEDRTEFKTQLVNIYDKSNQDANTISQAVRGVSVSSYGKKSLRFRNEDASAFILYLSSQSDTHGFSKSDAAAVWAQGQIAKNMRAEVGSGAGNLLNFSTQVYHLTHGMYQQGLATDSAALDADVKTKIQDEVDGIFKGSSAEVIAEIKASGCMKQPSGAACDSKNTAIGNEALEGIKEKIAAMASMKQMQGLGTYQLSNPQFDKSGNFTVKVDVGQSSATVANPATVSTTALAAPAVTTTQSQPAMVSTAPAAKVSAKVSTAPATSAPAAKATITTSSSQATIPAITVPAYNASGKTGQRTPSSESGAALTPPAQ